MLRVWPAERSIVYQMLPSSAARTDFGVGKSAGRASGFNVAIDVFSGQVDIVWITWRLWLARPVSVKRMRVSDGQVR